ncbi:MAG: phosphotransferase [Acidobacteria bacterium]|nr:phosphotransferase [Acidobacteriota bacterium]
MRVACLEDGSLLPGLEERPLAGDASTRRYSRVRAPDGSTAILARYPAESLAQFERDIAVAAWCEQHGLRVPRRYQVVANAGVCCFEDWGDDDAEAVLRRLDRRSREARALELIGPLETLASIPAEDLPPWNPPLDETRLRRELEGCETWFFKGVLKWQRSAAFGRWFDHLAARVARHPIRVCHRDYHLNNLFFLPEGTVGMLDIQDILAGPDTYDAVSLLGDRTFPELLDSHFQRGWLEHWARRTAAGPGWEQRARETQAQRGFKVLGTFARLSRQRRGSYVRWMAPLARRMAGLGEALGAPPRLVALLIDWAVEGELPGR